MDYIYWKKLVHFHFSNLMVIVGPFRETKPGKWENGV